VKLGKTKGQRDNARVSWI